jgi:hypothetical protein
VIHQTVKPDRLTLYDDSDKPIDMREIPLMRGLFQTLDRVGIKWDVVFGQKRGQQFNHQAANKSGHKYVWRLDDDEVAAPDVLEIIYHTINDNEKVGAVGGCVIPPDAGKSSIQKPNRIIDIFSEPNIQWFESDNIMQVEHLYSSFIYRAGIVDYNLMLSPVAHREETIFTHSFVEKGYALLFAPKAITYHYRNPEGGIRAGAESMFHHDEMIFDDIMRKWGYQLVVLDNGIGDHYMFLNILPALIQKYKKVILSCCYPDVFRDFTKSVKLISIAAVPTPLQLKYNVYKYMIDNNWKGHVIEAFAKLYGINFSMVKEV